MSTTAGQGLQRALAAALYLAGMLMMFRYEWLPGPGRSLGDNEDGAILIATLEHWMRVFTGHAADWLSPGWFWPVEGTIAYTDTYFLFAFPYAAARLLGADPFASYEVAVAALATTGFWTFRALARSLGVGAMLATAFAYVFAFGSLAIFKLGHGQTYAVMLVPTLGLLLLHAWFRDGRRAAAAALAAAAGVLYGLLALTAPQTAWFLAFDSALVAAIALAAAASGGRFRRTSWLALLRRFAPLALGGTVGLAAGLIPVAITYQQTATQRQREWSEVAVFMPRLTDILNVQPGNMLWHHLLYLPGIANLEGRPGPEVALGFTPGLLVAAVVGVAVIGWTRRPMDAQLGRWRALILGSLIAPIVAWLLTVEVDGASAWRLVFAYLPGAAGIRTPFRVQLVSLFFLCLGGAAGLSACLSAARRAGNRRWAAVTTVALACLCVAEQANSAISVRHTAEMRGWLDAAHPPAFACDVFYLLPRAGGPPLPWPMRQADAMLLSQVVGMPTVNGNSSWRPADWDLFEPDQPGYGARVLAWIALHGAGKGASFCGIDPRLGRWEAGTEPLRQ